MNKFRSIIAWLFGTCLIVNAFVFLPQLWGIWTTKKIDGISLTTLTLFSVMQFIATLHGIFQKDKALAIGMGISVLTCGATTLSVIYLRYFN